MKAELLEVVSQFQGYSFSTFDFAKKLETSYPDMWTELTQKYGAGGKGTGNNYSAYSYIAQQLNKLWNEESIKKLDYRTAPPEWGNAWIRYWSELKTGNDYPDEVRDSELLTEGAVKQISVNRYERDKNARTLCVEHYGLSCSVCQFDFEKVYGAHGAGFIHVHHLTPISTIEREYEVNPIEDLRPVCPNCHAMLHRSKKLLSIEQLKNIIRRSGNSA